MNPDPITNPIPRFRVHSNIFTPRLQQLLLAARLENSREVRAVRIEGNFLMFGYGAMQKILLSQEDVNGLNEDEMKILGFMLHKTIQILLTPDDNNRQIMLTAFIAHHNQLQRLLDVQQSLREISLSVASFSNASLGGIFFSSFSLREMIDVVEKIFDTTIVNFGSFVKYCMNKKHAVHGFVYALFMERRRIFRELFTEEAYDKKENLGQEEYKGLRTKDDLETQLLLKQYDLLLRVLNSESECLVSMQKLEPKENTKWVLLIVTDEDKKIISAECFEQNELLLLFCLGLPHPLRIEGPRALVNMKSLRIEPITFDPKPNCASLQMLLQRLEFLKKQALCHKKIAHIGHFFTNICLKREIRERETTLHL